MYCKKCGKILNPGEVFCASCGTKVENQINNIPDNNLVQNNQTQTLSYMHTLNNNSNYNQGIGQSVNQPSFNSQFQTNNSNSFNASNQMNNMSQQPASMQQEPVKPKKKKGIMIFAIIVGVIVLLVIIGSVSTEKLVCKSKEGDITIIYSKSGIIGYIAKEIEYDLSGQKKVAEQYGMDTYIKEFNNWFISNTSGTCTVNGKKVSKENEKVNNETTTTVVGDDKYGYITIPKSWGRFYDADGSTALQYSYVKEYIVSLNYFEDSQYTAKEHALNYMYNMKNSSEVTGVTGATLKIGKNKEYTAYQVYMYYVYDDIYLVTYWFEAEDGKVHYIALEGPDELYGVKLTDYLYIPESFSLKK